VQVEEVGETVGGYGERQSQVRVGVDRTALGRARLDSAIIERRDTDEDAGARSCNCLRRDAGVLDRLVGDLHEDSLLRIGSRRLTWRHTEERGIELVDTTDESTLAGIRLARFGGIRIVERAHVPAILRHVGDGIDTVGQQVPELCRVVRSTGEATADTDDRDRLCSTTGTQLVLGRKCRRVSGLAHPSVTPSIRAGYLAAARCALGLGELSAVMLGRRQGSVRHRRRSRARRDVAKVTGALRISARVMDAEACTADAATDEFTRIHLTAGSRSTPHGPVHQPHPLNGRYADVCTPFRRGALVSMEISPVSNRS
jgi:hypothetical protein